MRDQLVLRGACYVFVSLMLSSCLLPFYPASGALSDIGVLLPWDRGDGAYPFLGTRLVGAVDVALGTLNSEILTPGHRLGVIYKDTRCENIRGSGASVDLWQNNVSAFIGPPCSSPCKTVAYFAAYANTPMVSWFCGECVFAESESLPLFARVFPPFSRIARLGVAVITHFDWSVASIVAPHGTMWETLASEVYDKMVDASLDPIQPVLYEQPLNETVAISILEEAKAVSRIIWLIVGGYPTLEEDEFIFMSAAYKLGMTSGEFVFLRIELFPDPGFDQPWTKYNSSDLTGGELQEAYNAMLLLTHRLPWEAISPFLREVAFATLVADVPFGTSHRNMSILEPSIMSAFLHDAVMLFGVAYNQSLFNTNNSTTERNNISYEYFQDPNNAFEGKTGRLVLDSTGARISDFALYESTGSSAFYEVGTISGLDLTLSLFGNITIDWPGEGVPSDTPVCGFNNELCLDIRITMGIVVSGAVALGLAASAFFATVRYRKFMSRTDWLIEWDQLTLMKNKTNSGIHSNRSGHPLNSVNFSRHSLVIATTDDAKTKADLPSYAIATLNNVTVVLRRGKMENLVLNKETKRELKEMRWLVQDNINRFYGICVLPAPDNCFYHTSEFCSKGSLKGVLAKDDFNLDLSFKMSFIQDIAMGMQYLQHSEIKSHGLLCSAHCYIDSRWVLKISGFGSLSFQLFKEKAIEGAEPGARFTNMMWTSPELLRQELPVKGSQKGDVYSFGIMIHEIMTRTVPYSNFQLSSKVIIRRVMKREEPPFRPDTGQEEVSTKGSIVSELVDLKKLCWEELPENRPDFTSIRQRLRAMQKGHMSMNIMDNMLSKMEKYTENLEKVVESRTGQLLEEKKKTDALLYRMLPQMVADELKKGNTFPAESFDQVTIYFSDIVRFTDLSAESTPMQVVALLNDLYTCFDAVLEKFDVYKVETIGDAYMVVSGLPNRNGQRHASEIASMSLDIRDAVKDFKVRHRPDHQLQIRIGLNSGAVCAGVVGLTMPRFCLFGDTVNTASRMESNSLAQKVHVSSSCAKLLTYLGGYCLEYRGELAVKGKGNMHTFWLVGRMEECTDHETHNEMAGKKLSTDTLASIDSVLSPPACGTTKPGSNKNVRAEEGSLNEPMPEGSPSGPANGAQKAPVGTSQDSGMCENNNEVRSTNDRGVNLPGTVEGPFSEATSSPQARRNIFSNSRQSSKDPDLTKSRESGQSVTTTLSSGDVSPNISRSRKLNELLGQRAFQSFEEAARAAIEGISAANHAHKNGSNAGSPNVPIRGLGKASASFDNHGFSPATPRRSRAGSGSSCHGDIPLSTPRINIDSF